MQIVSIQFLLFLLVTIAVSFIIPKKIRNIWLLAASWVFYYTLSDKFLVLLVAVTVITYFAGLFMRKEADKGKKRTVLILSIVLLVGVLGYFKYAGFLVDSVLKVGQFFGLNGSDLVVKIILPAGISFYLFQAIGYIIDCYRETVEPEKNYLNLALFISFFPQIVSGPIERAGNMLPQYRNPKSFDYDNMRDGLLQILWGYFLKIVIADRLSVIVGTVYGSIGAFEGTAVFLATLCYTFEIYCDFAGYSSIAIGIAKILGIKLMDNFKSPYLAGSVAEFWRKWHISLSTWFRDYLYIPLGGNRKGQTRKLINLMIVFAVSGLWHGAAWTFVVWGILHGVFQVLGIVLKPVWDKVVDALKIDRSRCSHRFLKIAVTFMLVNIGWVFFRAETFEQALTILKSMWTITPWVITDGTLLRLGLTAADIYLLVGSLIVLIVTDICNSKGIILREKIVEQSLWMRWIIYIAAAIFVITCGVWGPGYDASSFIYSNF